MANVLNRNTGLVAPYGKDYRTSVNSPDFSVSEWIINPDLSAVQGFDTIYWDISGDNVTLADFTTRQARDAELADLQLQRQREDQKSRFDAEDVLRAVVKLLLDELNTLRGLHGLQPRTAEQARTAIRNAIDGGV